jgi:hypothetical protein
VVEIVSKRTTSAHLDARGQSRRNNDSNHHQLAFGREGGGGGGSLGVTGVSGWRRKKEREKMGNDICRCPFSRRTAWASHFMGPPSRFSTSNSLLIDAHIPLKKGGADAAGVC